MKGRLTGIQPARWKLLNAAILLAWMTFYSFAASFILLEPLPPPFHG